MVDLEELRPISRQDFPDFVPDRFGQRNRNGVSDLSVSLLDVFSAKPERIREPLGPGQLSDAEDPFLFPVRMNDPTLFGPGVRIGGHGREERLREDPAVASVPVCVSPEEKNFPN